MAAVYGMVQCEAILISSKPPCPAAESIVLQRLDSGVRGRMHRDCTQGRIACQLQWRDFGVHSTASFVELLVTYIVAIICNDVFGSRVFLAWS